MLVKRTRKFTRLIVGGLFLLGLLACLGGAVYLGMTYGRTTSTPPAAVIHWTTLPTPVRIQPNWTSFTNTQTVNDILWRDGFIWAATDGGVVVWDAATEEAAKFTVEHGLANNRVSSVAAAPDGTIWFGTASGVSRYDGRTWTTFTTADGLPANDIRDVLAAPDGRIWIATSAGVGRYDGRTWTIFNRTYSLLQLPDDDVRALAAGTAPGEIWAATAKGVAFYDGHRWQDYTQVGSQAVNDVRDVAVTPGRDVWAATAGGLKRLDGEQWQLFTTADGLAANAIRRLAPDGPGALWLAYDEAAHGLTHFDAAAAIPTAATETAVRQINAILPVPDGLLLATDGGLYLRRSGRTRPFPHPDDFALNPIRDLAWGSGAIWIGGDDGAARWDGAAWQPFGAAAGLTATAISHLFTGTDGQIWSAYDRPAQGVSYFQKGAWQPYACPPAGPPSDKVRGAVLADDGRIWFAANAGIAVTDGQNWDILNEGLPSANVQTIARGPDGRIWAGTNAGLAVWENSVWRSLNHDDVRELSIGPDGAVWFITENEIKRQAGDKTTIAPAPPVSQVYDFLAVEDGFWLAAAEGIARYTKDSYQSYPGLAGAPPTALLRGADGTIWAASSEQTSSSHSDFGSWQADFVYLNRFDGQAWRPRLLTNPTGPNHAAVTAILPAPDGRVWLGTLGGVSRFDGETWQAWNRLHGLPDDAILDLAWGDGAVWAVTPQGMARYDPKTNRWQAAELTGVWRVPGNVTLAAAPDGTLWAAAEGAVRHRANGVWQAIPLTLPHPQADIRAITVDGNGRLWAAAYASSESIPEAERHYLGVYDGAAWRWRRLVWPSGGGRAAVDWLTFAPDGTLWLGTSTGLWTLDAAAETAQPDRWPVTVREATAVLFDANGRGWASGRFQTELIPLDGGAPVPIPLPQAKHLYTLAQTADGTIWVGTDGGAARLSPDGGWELFYGPEPAAVSLPTTLFDDGASLWLGTFGGAVWRIADGRAQEIWPPLTPQQANPVSALLRDGSGALWLGSFGGGAARRDGRSWTTFQTQPELFRARVADAAIAPDGTVWLGTDAGLFTIGGAVDEPECSFVPAGREILAQALAVDLQNNVWAVSEGTLWRGDQAGFARAATLTPPALTAAPDGTVWFVTERTLVRELNGRRQEISLADVPGEITDIALGADGRIWLGTTAGAAVREEGQWRLLTTQDGLGDNLVLRVQPRPDGSVWFLTGGGVSWLRP